MADLKRNISNSDSLDNVVEKLASFVEYSERKINEQSDEIASLKKRIGELENDNARLRLGMDNAVKLASANDGKVKAVSSEAGRIFKKFAGLGFSFFNNANNDISTYISDPVNVVNGYRELADTFVDMSIDGNNVAYTSYDGRRSAVKGGVKTANYGVYDDQDDVDGRGQADLIYYDNTNQTIKGNVTYRQSGGSYASSYENSLREKLASENRAREEAFLRNFTSNITY